MSKQTKQEASEENAGKKEYSAASSEEKNLGSALEELNAKYLRLAADFDNFKKRSRQERADFLRYAGSDLAGLLLPVVDDFERVLEHAPEDVEESWLKGVRMTVDKLVDALASVGVKPIEAVGERFDPQLHEAIATEETDSQEEDTVLAEVRRGYRMYERVLRPTLVRVSRKPKDETPEAASPGNSTIQEAQE